MTLHNQWIEHQKKSLESLGIDAENLSDENISIYYFEYFLRILHKMNYEVYFSKELIENPLYNNFKFIIETIKNIAINGEDLKPYLSRGITNLNKPDKMLNDWGVYHLHLGKSIEIDGFINRTKELLFVYRDIKMNPKKLYFLDIYNHGDWSKKRTIEILHNNWPKAIEHYKIEGLVDIQPKMNDEEHLLMRNADINSAVEMSDGTAYIMLGGGITSAGTNQEATVMHMSYLRFFRDLEYKLMQQYSIKSQQIKLKLESGMSYVYLDTSNLNEKQKIIPLDLIIL